ncbi:hypothetical protein ACHAXA_006752 [Cyclostephanos tholiformis]|uniref:Hexose transporter 1 n=1 Tax=Cyclostephanos tholiformis TaxID=382380 RepID=A0ABD3SSJ7_9STRA
MNGASLSPTKSIMLSEDVDRCAAQNDDERQRLLSNGNGRIPTGYTTSQPMPFFEQVYRSQPQMSNMIPTGQMITKSYSVNADGSLSYLTPLQLGRHELYEMVPFAAVFGMQQKERNITKAFANYAADMDTLEAAQQIYNRTKRHLTAAELSSRKHHSELFLLEELEVDTVVITTPLMFALFMAGISQFLVGYNTSVMNSPSSVVFKGHTTFQWSLAVAVFAIGGPFGAIAAGKVVDSRGRRSSMGIVIYLFLLGSLVQTFAMDLFCITVARFIIGFASGFSSVLVPIYLGELAPPTLRGTLGTLTQFCLVIGIFVSDLLAFPFANEQSWRILFSVTGLGALVQIICYPFLIESPRWLLSHDPKSINARHIIKKLRGLRYEHEVEMEAAHFISASHVQACDNNDDHTSSGIAFVSMLMDKQVRRLLICSLVLQMAQQFCGINAVFYYSTMLFDGVLDSPLLGTTLVAGVNVLATYAALRLMENTNRRTLLLWSAGGMLVSSIALVICLLGYFSKFSSLFWVIAYVSFFEIGLGPIPWLIVAEMFEARYVATAMSVSCQLNWACNFIVGLVFPYLQESLGAFSFVPFAAVLFMTLIFVLIFLPETKGTTPEELRDEIARNLSAFLATSHDTTYEDHSSSAGNPIDVEWRRAMDDLRRQEELDMLRGAYNYGFQHIDLNHLAVESDWRTYVAGELDRIDK